MRSTAGPLQDGGQIVGGGGGGSSDYAIVLWSIDGGLYDGVAKHYWFGGGEVAAARVETLICGGGERVGC